MFRVCSQTLRLHIWRARKPWAETLYTDMPIEGHRNPSRREKGKRRPVNSPQTLARARQRGIHVSAYASIWVGKGFHPPVRLRDQTCATTVRRRGRQRLRFLALMLEPRFVFSQPVLICTDPGRLQEVRRRSQSIEAHRGSSLSLHHESCNGVSKPHLRAG